MAAGIVVMRLAIGIRCADARLVIRLELWPERKSNRRQSLVSRVVSKADLPTVMADG